MEGMHALRASLAEDVASIKGRPGEQNAQKHNKTDGGPSQQYIMPFASIDHRKMAARKRAGWEQRSSAKRR